jgi:hypothetical protein
MTPLIHKVPCAVPPKEEMFHVKHMGRSVKSFLAGAQISWMLFTFGDETFYGMVV